MTTALLCLCGAALVAAPQPGMPVRVGGNVKAPTKIKNVAPKYPEIAQSTRVQGVVIIEATIDPEGKVSDARIIQSIPLLDQAALDAVRQWEYTPTVLNGVAVPVIMTVTVNFTLSDGPPGGAIPRLLPGGPPGGLSPAAIRLLVATKDAPFTADVSVLLDQKSTSERLAFSGSMARDGAGRTRIEFGPASATDGMGRPQVTLILDPVRSVAYTLAADRKEAFERPLDPQPPPTGSEAGPDCVPLTQGPNPQQVTPLGTQTLEGLTVSGCRTTQTLKGPAGDVDALVERWFSPNLQTYVLLRATNPMADGTYQLTNITRTEPDATLFQIPPDYRVVPWSEAKPPQPIR
jgi:TonB family protein